MKEESRKRKIKQEIAEVASDEEEEDEALD